MELLEGRQRRKDFVRVLLSDDHRHLEDLFHQLVAGVRCGEPTTLRSEWQRFEREVLSHLELEEKEILPAFARQHRGEAAALLEEHDAIRAELTELGVSLDLHCLRADAVEDFIALLRAHARREEALLYPWASRAVG